MHEVLVVGAGPVGLTMAAELARHGVRPRIIDKAPAPLPYCRAIGVTPRTLEVYDDMGIVDAMLSVGLWVEGLRVIGPDGAVHDAIPDFSDLPYGPICVRQPESERVLAEHLATFGVAPERGVALTALRQDEGRVVAALEHADGRREDIPAAYVVGCDGAHSTVRKALDIAFEGEAMPMGFMLGEVTMRPSPPRGFALRAVVPRPDDAPDMFIAVPVVGRDRFRVSSIAPVGDAGDPGHGISAEKPGPDISVLQAVADRLLPQKVTLSEMSWSSYFRISMRLAARYREGRVFLAGDAAHIHPPTGGQGMNTGIQDAYNLAWKLALVVRGVAGQALLDSYEAERRPVGADVIARTTEASLKLGRETTRDSRLADTQILVAYPQSPIVGPGLDGGRSGAGASGGAAPQGAQRGAGIGDATASLRPGDRAPDAAGLVRAHVRHPIRLHGLLRGTAHVLVVQLKSEPDAPGTPSATLEALAASLAGRLGDLIRIVAIAAAPVAADDRPVGVATHVDEAGTFASAYRGAGAWLVRPDGYLGAVLPEPTEAAVVAYFERLFG